tara:strand:- start:379 stop:549 length:171 start_codon:yes stop_codon:yes gene_type:complete
MAKQPSKPSSPKPTRPSQPRPLKPSKPTPGSSPSRRENGGNKGITRPPSRPTPPKK